MAHELITPQDMAPAVGFSHAVVAEPGRTVYLGGMTAQRPDGSITGSTLVEQFDVALSNLVTALHAARCEPTHLVSMTVYTTDTAAYRASLRDLGRAYRNHLGKHYPAMALFGIAELFDPDALVEIVATAVRPG